MIIHGEQSMSRHRVAAAIYAALLIGVTVLGWIPALADANGRLFGIFRLTWYNDLLHLGSAAWALGATIVGEASAVLFLRVFGALYLADGLMGLAIGSRYLDLGIVFYGVRDLPLAFKIFANTPHIVLGAVALAIGVTSSNLRSVRAE
jgi:Domain of unknown function (DUF4383)